MSVELEAKRARHSGRTALICYAAFTAAVACMSDGSKPLADGGSEERDSGSLSNSGGRKTSDSGGAFVPDASNGSAPSGGTGPGGSTGSGAIPGAGGATGGASSSSGGQPGSGGAPNGTGGGGCSSLNGSLTVLFGVGNSVGLASTRCEHQSVGYYACIEVYITSKKSGYAVYDYWTSLSQLSSSAVNTSVSLTISANEKFKISTIQFFRATDGSLAWPDDTFEIAGTFAPPGSCAQPLLPEPIPGYSWTTVGPCDVGAQTAHVAISQDADGAPHTSAIAQHGCLYPPQSSVAQPIPFREWLDFAFAEK